MKYFIPLILSVAFGLFSLGQEDIQFNKDIWPLIKKDKYHEALPLLNKFLSSKENSLPGNYWTGKIYRERALKNESVKDADSAIICLLKARGQANEIQITLLTSKRYPDYSGANSAEMVEAGNKTLAIWIEDLSGKRDKWALKIPRKIEFEGSWTDVKKMGFIFEYDKYQYLGNTKFKGWYTVTGQNQKLNGPFQLASYGNYQGAEKIDSIWGNIANGNLDGEYNYIGVDEGFGVTEVIFQIEDGNIVSAKYNYEREGQKLSYQEEGSNLSNDINYYRSLSQGKRNESQESTLNSSNDLPNSFFGDWLRVGSELPCEVAPSFSIWKRDNDVGLSSGTEFGGYDIKVTKKNDYYKLDFEKRSEGEAWQSTIHLKLINDNLHIAWDGKDGEWMKYTKCPN